MKPEAEIEVHAKELDDLIDHGQLVLKQIAGTSSTSRRANGANIFAKLLAHAITLRNAVPVRGAPVGALIDLGSACVLARAIMEAWDAMFFIALDQMTDEEQSFRVAMWELHANERVLAIMNSYGVESHQIEKRAAARDEAMARVLTHPQFAALDSREAKKVRDGKGPAFHLTQAVRNQRAKVNQDFYSGLEMNFSQYVHTFPHAVIAVATFSVANSESLRRVLSPIGAATAFLAKALDGMHQLFPELPPPAKEVSIVVKSWCDIVERGMNT